MDSIKNYITKHKWLFLAFDFHRFFIIFLPQWLDAMWDLAEKIEGRQVTMPHPDIIWVYWITVPIGLIMFGVAIWAVRGTKNVWNIEQIKTQTDALISEISQFAADRELGHPLMSTKTDRASMDEQFQKNVQYSATTNSLFVARFHQKIMDIGYIYRNQGLLTDEEWKRFIWITQPEHPVIQWVLDALKGYRVKLR